MGINTNHTYWIKSHGGRGHYIRFSDTSNIYNTPSVILGRFTTATNRNKWLLKKVSGMFKLACHENNSYGLSRSTNNGCVISAITASNENSDITFVKLNATKSIYKIRLTLSGNTYKYLTASDDSDLSSISWEPAISNDMAQTQEWRFIDVNSTTVINVPSGRNCNWNQFSSDVYSQISSSLGCSWCCMLDVANIYGPSSYVPTSMPSSSWGPNGVVWNNLPIGCSATIQGDSSYATESLCLAAIKAEIDINRPVIVKLQHVSGYHYVVAYGYLNSGTSMEDILVFDPASKTGYPAPSSYVDGNDWTLAESASYNNNSVLTKTIKKTSN